MVGILIFLVALVVIIFLLSQHPSSNSDSLNRVPSGTSLSSTSDDELNEKLTNNLRQSLQAKKAAVSAAAASVKAGGNVGYIAQNVATIYYCICHYADTQNKLTDNQRIYAALLIDSIAYLQNGQIDPAELQSSVRAASVYEFGSNHFTQQRVYDLFNAPDFAELICATADLETLMFCAESNLDYHSVIDFVNRSIPQIESMIQRTITQGDASPLFEDIIPLVLGIFHQDSFLHDLDTADV